jgi:hypothetical protein
MKFSNLFTLFAYANAINLTFDFGDVIEWTEQQLGLVSQSSAEPHDQLLLSEQAAEVGFDLGVISYIYLSEGNKTPSKVIGYKNECAGSLAQATMADLDKNAWTFLMESKSRADLFALRALDKEGACGVVTLTA